MTKRKRNAADAIGEQLSFTELMAQNLEVIEADITAPLQWFPGDAILQRYVEERDLLMVVARTMELTMLRTPQDLARLLAACKRSETTSRRNKADSEATRKDALAKLQRNLDAGMSLADALSTAFPGKENRSQRERVRKWYYAEPRPIAGPVSGRR